MNGKLIFIALMMAGCAAQVGAQTNEGRRGPDGPRNGPPPEAIAACQDKAAGDSCSFSGRQKEQVSGTCFSPPADRPQGSQPDANASNKTRPTACRPANDNRR